MNKGENTFQSAPLPSTPSNRFGLKHNHKTTFKMGELVPTMAVEVLPGDIFNLKAETMIRFAPLVAPAMHEIKTTTHHFFVANRTLWPNWEKFIGGDQELEHPWINISNGDSLSGKLGEYMGMNAIPVGTSLKINPFPAVAYHKIFDFYYRDQNLIVENEMELTDGENTNLENLYNVNLLKRAWNHDYFTSGLPFLQKGEQAQIPMSGIVQLDYEKISALEGNKPFMTDSDGFPTSGTGGGVWSDPTTGELRVNAASQAGKNYIDPNGSLIVDAGIDGTIINLRKANALQVWLEINARAGTRYNELVRAHFGARIPDSRIQQPEYIGGSKGRVRISEVLSTAETSDGTNTAPVGSLSGHGIALTDGRSNSYRATEHGWIISITNVQPTTAYHQGIPKQFVKESRFDYAWPSFAHVGEQAIQNFEIYTDLAPANVPFQQQQLEKEFAYIPRYSEYKYQNDRISGLFKNTLDFWTLTREFDELPLLNEEFITCDPSTRIFAEEITDHLYVHIYNDISVIRSLPKFGVPRL